MSSPAFRLAQTTATDTAAGERNTFAWQRIVAKLGEALEQAPGDVGFNTYGEQCRGLHLDQAFTGTAPGCGPREAHHA